MSTLIRSGTRCSAREIDLDRGLIAGSMTLSKMIIKFGKLHFMGLMGSDDSDSPRTQALRRKERGIAPPAGLERLQSLKLNACSNQQVQSDEYSAEIITDV